MSKWTDDELGYLAQHAPQHVEKRDGKLVADVTREELYALAGRYPTLYPAGLFRPRAATPHDDAEQRALERRYPSMFDKKGT